MIPFTLNAHPFNIPSSWDEITTSQYLQIRKLKSDYDLCDLLSILTGVSRDLIFNAELSEINLEQIAASLEWMKDAPDFLSMPVPDITTIGGKTIPVDKSLGVKTIGQKIFFEQKVFPYVTEKDGVVKSIEPECIPEALAIYFQPHLTGKKFDPEDLKATVEQCASLPITVSAPIANFFLKKYFGLENQNQSSRTHQTPITSQPEQQTLINSEI